MQFHYAIVAYIKPVWYVSLGKYGQDESLLHLCVRQKLEGAASYLLQNIRGREVFLQQRDHKGKTPSEIARKKGEKRIADMLDKAVVSSIKTLSSLNIGSMDINFCSNRRNILRDHQPQVC